MLIAKKNCIYYIKKILIFIISILLLSIIVFYISRLAPGDPLEAYYGDRVEKMSTLERQWAEKKLGLDEPIHIQYIRWLENVLKGDFGISYKYKTAATEVIGSRLVNTMLLGGVGFVIIFVLSLLLGVFCAWNEDKFIDRAICKTGTIINCVPEFWLSLMLILIFSVNLRLLPAGGAYSPGYKDHMADRLIHLILPMTVVVVNHLWYYAYLVRNKLLDELRAEYVLTAKAKGLGKTAVIWKHCVRNVMPAYLSIMAISVPHIMGGTYIVEAVFSYPGIGTLAYESARYQDYNMLMLVCLLSGAVVILCNMLAQIINERIDPGLRDDDPVESAEVMVDE